MCTGFEPGFLEGVAVWAWHISLALRSGMYMLSVQISETNSSAGLGSGLGYLS